MDIKNIIITIVIVSIISSLLGILLAFVSKRFYVEKDNKLDEILNMLPGYNCGACGKAGCSGLAEAILKDKEEVNKCKPMKKEQKEKILDFLSNNN